jgi:GNAT superfamily N-acetyltransferase
VASFYGVMRAAFVTCATPDDAQALAMTTNAATNEAASASAVNMERIIEASIDETVRSASLRRRGPRGCDPGHIVAAASALPLPCTCQGGKHVTGRPPVFMRRLAPAPRARETAASKAQPGRTVMTHRIEMNANPSPADRAEIWRRIEAFNDAYTGPEEDRQFALLVTDEQDGSPHGGLWGRTYYGWMFIELLIIDEKLRGGGIGTELMRRAEEEARRRGCHGIWLDSFSFQAPDFYRRLGYEIFGVLDDYPPGDRRYFLKKRLDAG